MKEKPSEALIIAIEAMERQLAECLTLREAAILENGINQLNSELKRLERGSR